ncbi:unnamed protein product [Nezara viridula]|uniref:Uncharacterized protein n=1 Tax=Nezara viridula TaxID=85310 RepID=A0A9P0EB50_NEZVI|nr:unnamed protein product [Nezara viridula]
MHKIAIKSFVTFSLYFVHTFQKTFKELLLV